MQRQTIETKPEFPRTSYGDIRLQTVIDMVRRSTYAGFLCVKTRGIHMRPAQHEPLISVEVWEKAKARLDGAAHAPAKANLMQDFPLRGFVLCGSCNKPMTAGWSKGRSRHYGYYICQHRGCPSRNKSVRKEKLEGAFLEVVRGLSPAPALFDMAKDIFRRFWEQRMTNDAARREGFVTELATLERKTESLTDRLIGADEPAVIKAYEGQLAKLETKKRVLKEQTSKALEPQKPFEALFDQAWAFLANPSILWENGNYDHKRLLLRLAFTDNLAYCRDTGFAECLNRKIALPFGTYEKISGKSKMVPRRGTYWLFFDSITN